MREGLARDSLQYKVQCHKWRGESVHQDIELPQVSSFRILVTLASSLARNEIIGAETSGTSHRWRILYLLVHATNRQNSESK